MRTGRRGSVIRLLGAVLLGGLLVLAAWTWVAYRDPASLDQDYLFELATRSGGLRMERYPKRHEVLIEPLRRTKMLSALLGYLPAPVGTAGDREAQGYFDTRDESIHILGDLARLQGGLPRPYPRTYFLRALRHEYGHAFFFDWTQDNGGVAIFQRTIDTGQDAHPNDFPEAMRELVAEYTAVAAGAYGDTYFTDHLSEYLAESYARLLDGQEVPPATRAFIEKAAR